MARVSGNALVGRALKNEAVKAVFTLSGALSGIYDTCVEEGIELIDMRHEQRSEERRVGKECRSRWSP